MLNLSGKIKRKLNSTLFSLLNRKNDGKPINYQSTKATPELVQKDAEYALQVAKSYLEWVAGKEELAGKTVLEIGPGPNCASMLILAGYGAEVLVVDRFISPWNSNYHSKLYSAVRKMILRELPDCNTRPLEQVISEKKHSDSVIKLYETPLELLEGIPEESVDIVFSNAVLEHIFNHSQAFKKLGAVSKPGSLGFHQVDFRDHRVPSKPLEYLLLAPEEFKELFDSCHGECGSQIRPVEMVMLFKNSGFEIMNSSSHLNIDDKYLDDFIPRLRNSPSSAYSGFSREKLEPFSVRLDVKRGDI